MKKFILLSLVLTSFTAFATEVITILDTRIAPSYEMHTTSSKFYVDTKSGLGYAKVAVDEIQREVFPGPVRCDEFGCYPDRQPTQITRRVFSEQVMIAKLRLENKEMIYTTEDGEVNCGRLGTSRIFKIPTIYLSGKCVLRETLNYDRLKVTLTIK